MKTKMVKATFVLELPLGETGDFLLAHVEDVLEMEEKILGFSVVDTNLKQLKSEGLSDMLFTDD